MARRVTIKPCSYCGAAAEHPTAKSFANTPVCCTKFQCLQSQFLEVQSFNEAVSAERKKLNAAQREKRKSQQPFIPATDWNMLVAFTAGQNRKKK